MTRRGSAAHTAEQGSAAVLAVVTMAVVTVAAMLAMTGGGLLVSHRRAASAADLAALAAAAARRDGRDACAAAADIARANRAEVTSCDVGGETVDVQVATEVATAWGAGWSVTARARAGPASAS